MLISFIILMIAIGVILSLLSTAFWIWMTVDCVMNKRLSDTQKALWVVLILFTHFIGALIYFFAGRQGQPRQATYQYYEQSRSTYHFDPPPPNRPYEQGYQPPPPVQRNAAPPFQQEQAQRVDFEQPQAMYPHEQHND